MKPKKPQAKQNRQRHESRQQHQGARERRLMAARAAAMQSGCYFVEQGDAGRMALQGRAG